MIVPVRVSVLLCALSVIAGVGVATAQTVVVTGAARESTVEVALNATVVGSGAVDSEGVALRGLLVRHLVLPEDLANTERVLAFLAEEISPDTYLNLMDQYHPSHRADRVPALDRATTTEEYLRALEIIGTARTPTTSMPTCCALSVEPKKLSR